MRSTGWRQYAAVWRNENETMTSGVRTVRYFVVIQYLGRLGNQRGKADGGNSSSSSRTVRGDRESFKTALHCSPDHTVGLRESFT